MIHEIEIEESKMDGGRSTSNYEFMTWGNCLGGLVPNGSFMTVDPQAEIHVGDIVAIALKRHGPFSSFVRSLTVDDLLGVTKIFLGSHISIAGEVVYLVGQLNPPTISPIPAGALEAMHLVIGGAAAGEHRIETECRGPRGKGPVGALPC